MTELFYGSSAGTTDVHDVAGAPADAVRSFERGGGMSERDYVRFRELKMFMHHIYEFKKGVRNLVLCTMCPTCAALVTERLRGPVRVLRLTHQPELPAGYVPDGCFRTSYSPVSSENSPDFRYCLVFAENW